MPGKNADGEARFEVGDVKLITNKGLKNKDIAFAISIIEENKEIIIAKWKEYMEKKVVKVWFDNGRIFINRRRRRKKAIH